MGVMDLLPDIYICLKTWVDLPSLYPMDNISNNIGCLKGQNDTSVHKDGLEGLVDSSQTMLSSLERVPSLPKDDISWRGKCRISHQMGYNVSFELKAHLSTSSSSNVVEAAQTLPMALDLEMVPKTKSWPKRFDELQPSDEDIGLYFFPMHLSYEKLCSDLFDKIMEDDLVLKYARDDFKLRMFTSFDLPKEICPKMMTVSYEVDEEVEIIGTEEGLVGSYHNANVVEVLPMDGYYRYNTTS